MSLYISNEQKKIVESESRIRKVYGCAGSRKTDTMIKSGIYYILKEKRPRNCLYLTLVGSVTDEITTRLSNLLEIPIEKQGISNHYIGNWKNHCIEIANYDAFIHRQLQEHEEYNVFHTDFDKKAFDLLSYIKKNEHDIFYLKNGKKCDMILVDEFQDISNIRVEILMEYFKKNQETRLIVMGDLLQTIFPQALQDLRHPLYLMDELRPKIFRLNKCFRCPKSHIDVVNCITETFRNKHNIPEMEHNFELRDNKPLFFVHDSISTHFGAYETAKMIYKMIELLMKEDDKISYKDIAIIMKRSNHQLVFHYILLLFQKNQKGDKCLFSKTKSYFNDHQPINWNEGKEKLMMLSIHGDKGKGHEVVFFVGFSGNVIPEERHLNRLEEILSQSLLNVALTRSTNYLFIGMTKSLPSVYFTQNMFKLRDISYFSWLSNEIKHPILKNISRLIQNDKPSFHRCNIRNNVLLTPIKNIIYIHQDTYSHLFLKKPKIEKEKIGKLIKYHSIEDRSIIIYTLSKLLFLRKIKPKLISQIFQNFLTLWNQERVFFTEDFSLLSYVKENQLNQLIMRGTNIDIWFQMISKFSLGTSNSMLIIHSIFKNTIKQNLEGFINQSNQNIDSWNSCIFYMEYIEMHCHNMIFYYNSPGSCFDLIPQIQYNIDNYIDYCKNQKIEFKNVRYLQKSSLMDIILDEESLQKIGFQKDIDCDQKYFIEGYKFGLSSTIDFIETRQKILIDFRFHIKNECKEEWLAQNIMHALLSHYNQFSKISQIHIFNILKGTIYTFSFSIKNYCFHNLLQDLLQRYEFHPIMITRLQEKFNKMIILSK